MPLTCTDPTCDRRAARRLTTDGVEHWWCMWHPTATPPAVDQLSGKLREPQKQTPLRPTPKGKPEPAHRTPSPVKAAAKAPRKRPAPDRHRPDDVVPADGLCARGCGGQYKHRGVCRGTRAGTSNGPTGKPLQAQDIARRYQAGEGLAELADDLHVSTRRIRQTLTDQGVTIRGRGDVLHRTPEALLDVDRCRSLYAAGTTVREIGVALGVRSARVAQQLRADGLLKQPPRADCDIRVRLNQQQTQQVRQRTAALGLPITDYLRSLVLADLDQQQTQAGAA